MKNVSDSQAVASNGHSTPAADDLFNAWSQMYDLNETNSMDSPISPVVNGKHYTLAPHLQDCFVLTREREKLERRKLNLSPPDWTNPSPGNHGPSPPWIKGADEDNLELTRFTQAELWKHQFPPNCSAENINFGIVSWKPSELHGLGSQLHVFSTHFQEGLSEGRVIVADRWTYSFSPADQKTCNESAGSLSCFFFPETSPDCVRQALELWTKYKDTNPNKIRYISFPNTVVPKMTNYTIPPSDALKPWMKKAMTVEVMGQLADFPEIDRKVNWWHSQIVRFLLRWPTRFMCHNINKVRHSVYGRETAQMVFEVEEDQRKAMALVLASNLGDADDVRLAGQLSVNSTIPSLGSKVWLKASPYIPRPIVSVHVRQGDKEKEMKIFSFASHMWLAEKLRTHVPDIKYVWLSTEMQAVVEEAKIFNKWKFYYTKNERQVGNMSMFSYAKRVGRTKLAVLSFANLVIASECDYFVGALASNWGRLIHELRVTSGKLNHGVLVVNYEEW